ncbi:MAG: PQQ-binding-like beta-propeller repeat protein [Bauldia sp.]|nr:PQQ-binding-like beta-propeller repeat protein [Bauldia sp.]
MTFDRLLNPEPENWLQVHGTYNHWRYSLLEEITPENVGSLRLAFAAALGPAVAGGRGSEGIPVVDDGFLYIANSQSVVFKFNVQSGINALPLWSFDTGLSFIAPGPVLTVANRGLALSGDAVFVNNTDGLVVAIDRQSGEAVWEQQLGIPAAEGMTGQPFAVKDVVLIGNSRGDWGTRGWVAALDAVTGDERWRFYTIPGPGEAGHETWLNDAWETGGGGVWTQPSYDPDTNLVFVGVGNAAPAFDPAYRPGDNLYTTSTVALDADTGALAWYHQFVANEGFEWDEVSPNLIIDTEVAGESRQVLAHHSTRNGYFYVLDRLTGEHILAAPNAPSVDWTAGFDPKTGLPVEYDPDADIQSYDGINATRDGSSRPICTAGVHWGGNAYNPDLNRVYSVVMDSCSTRATAAPDYDEIPYVFGNVVDGRTQGYRLRSVPGAPVPDDMLRTLVGPHLTAVDVSTGETVAAVPVLGASPIGGTFGTATGLIFVGYNDGGFRAYDADTLQQLWEMNLGTPIRGPAMSYAVDGKQYIAVTGSGNNETAMLWVFAL